MRLNEATSITLRYCLFSGIALISLGLILSESEYGNNIMWIGLLILVTSPLIAVIVTYYHLIIEKDWKWLKIATVLILLIATGLLASLLLR